MRIKPIPVRGSGSRPIGLFRVDAKTRIPAFADPLTIRALESRLERAKGESDTAAMKSLRQAVFWGQGSLSGEPFVYSEQYNNCDARLGNVFASRCYTCHRVAIWVHQRLIFPAQRQGALPHPDLPDDIRHDFEEARAILGASPRGAAALLRLCVQKLCKELGEKGKNIDQDIASLVTRGLDEMVQRGLDSVRVIGNEAVHPGQLDLRDDPETALTLLELVNDITAQTIARKKRADAIYARLPDGKRKAIEERDKGAINQPAPE